MSDEFTPAQRAAVEARGVSVVLSSGAGCGKTHVLTARYLSHLTADAAAVGRVVAITFTERAARQMRDRIRTAVEKLPDPGRHLRDLETAPITTIHGFCGSLLRQHAVPAGLDPGFDVLDEVLAATLRAEAVGDSLRELLTQIDRGAASPAADALRELVVLYGYPAVTEAVDGLVAAPDRPGWDDFLARPPADIAADWAGPARAALLPEWVAYLTAGVPKIARCLTVLETAHSPNTQVMTNARRLLAEVPTLHAATNLAAAVAGLTELAKVGRGGKKDWPDAATYEAVRDAFTDFRAELPKRLEVFAETPPNVEAAAHVGQQFLRVAGFAADRFRTAKRRAGALDFQDLLTRARDLLRDHPAVRDAPRKRFQFILLDEVQDTDPVQMELVELLCGDGLTAGKLFAVGDPKQSIYRFRGADVGLFRRLRAAVPEAGRLGMARNYRSRPGVLRFVNTLFARRLADYDPLDVHAAEAAGESNVELLWSESTQGADAPRSDARVAEADVIAARVVALLADPTPRVYPKAGPPRRAALGDVTLLFRSMTHVATYEAALRRHGLDYYLVGGRALFAQQEVYDLLNLVRAVENPYDATSLVGVLRSPFVSLTDEAVFLLAGHADGPWGGLTDPARVATLPVDQRPVAERAREMLAGWRAAKDRLPAAALLRKAVAESQYDAALQFEFLGERKLANLWKLIDLAGGFDRSGLFGLHEFAARLADLVARQPREEQAATLPETANVVKLMSIHQAKGLEFPVVVVPDFAAVGRGGQYPAARWDRRLGCLPKLPAEFEDAAEPPFPAFADRLGRTSDQLADWQEDLRVLYVACTRARDLLVLSAGLPGPLSEGLPGTHWTLLLGERFDPVTGRCLTGDGSAVRVILAEDNLTPQPPLRSGEGEPEPTPPVLEPPPQPPPAVVSLAVLEGADPPTWAAEDDADRADWRTPRERLASLTPADRATWAVFDRWDFADPDGWADLLAAADLPASAADRLRAGVRRFAESDARFAVAASLEVHRSVETTADLAAFAGEPGLPVVCGTVDVLYRDARGWHLLALDPGTGHEDDPWRGRRPGLVLQAWAVSQALGTWPTTVELFDMANGQWVQTDPRRFKAEAVAAWFRRHV